MAVKKVSEFLPKAFHDTWRAALNPDILNIVEKGGRGSGKSSDIAHVITQLLMWFPVNAIGIRYVDNTLELSIFEQMKWAISEQGVSHLFKVNKSPMKITYLPRGNYMAFRCAQNPERLKSIKDARFPFAIGWIEELAEFKTEDEVTTITNSLLRGELDNGLFYKFFFTYNPPKRRQSWVNKKYETSFQADNTHVHHSTYLDNPFISKAFINEAEATKERSLKRYEWEYLGKAIGSGVVPFDNLKVVAGSITDEMAENFDNIRNAVDFGYATDPLAFVRWHYDKKHNGIYAIDEYFGQKISNREFAKWLKKKGYQSDAMFADSAEPKSIAELKNEHDIKRIKGVKKGPDSVEYGEEWLDDLDFICIDPLRTPNIAREFENIDYQTDSEEVLKYCIEQYQKELIRLQKLSDYYDGKHEVLEHKLENGNAKNVKVMVNNAKYTTDMNVGFLVGNPISYSAGKDKNIDPVLDTYEDMDVVSHDTELEKDLSVFGIVLELIYLRTVPGKDKETEIRIKVIDSRGVFLVTEDTVEKNSLFAVHYYEKFDLDGKSIG